MTFPEEEDSPVILEYVIADYRRIAMVTRTYVVNFEPKSAEGKIFTLSIRMCINSCNVIRIITGADIEVAARKQQTIIVVNLARERIKPMTFPEEEDSPVILEYVIADYRRIAMVTRTYVVNFEPKSAEECPIKCICIWDSSKKISPCPELALKPVAICRDPFRLGRHKIVLCEVRYVDKPDKIVEFNTRIACKDLMDKVADKEPLYAFEQEYFVVDKNGIPLDWSHYSPEMDFDLEINVGSHSCIERDLAETHLRACLYAGLAISGMNREMFPSEWEYQVGPLPGLQACDQVYISRYILLRLAEMHNLHVTFKNPDCTRDTDVRSALHLNFSTKPTRGDGGIEHLHKLIGNIGKHSQEAIMKYYDLKEGTEMRWFLSGIAYMPHYDEFTCKIGEKDGCSIRIPALVALKVRVT